MEKLRFMMTNLIIDVIIYFKGLFFCTPPRRLALYKCKQSATVGGGATFGNSGNVILFASQTRSDGANCIDSESRTSSMLHKCTTPLPRRRCCWAVSEIRLKNASDTIPAYGRSEWYKPSSRMTRMLFPFPEPNILDATPLHSGGSSNRRHWTSLEGRYLRRGVTT